MKEALDSHVDSLEAPKRPPHARITVSRDGSVLVDGQAIGSVRGEPRDWWYSLAEYRPLSRKNDPGPYHSKRDAAEACARAYRETTLAQ